MKRTLMFFVALAVICSCSESKKDTIPEISNDWEFKMISQGNNKPDFNPNKDSLKHIPILLHEGYTPAEIQDHFHWTDAEFKTKADLLSKAGFIKKESANEAFASLMIISEEEGEEISEYLTPVTNAIAREIEQSLDSVKHKAKAIKCLDNFDFEDVSLLILSNVLLDNGQINKADSTHKCNLRGKV